VQLNLSTTELRGELEMFSTMTRLTSLDLSTCGYNPDGNEPCSSTYNPNKKTVLNTYISGSLESLAPLTQLRTLHLNGTSSFNCVLVFGASRYNRVTGSAAEFAHLTHLTSLNIGNGNTEFGCDDGVFNASLGNKITGELPLWMLRESERMAVDITDNLIAMPHNIGDLRPSRPSGLNVAGWGFLAGPLPPSLGKLTSLQRLSLAATYYYQQTSRHDNSFNGSIDPLSTLTQLSSLDISYNHFGGELPLWMLRKNLTGQMELNLIGNDDIGLPHDIGSLNGTLINTTLDLSGQGLGGPLPASFSNLTSLRELNLAMSNFGGSISPLWTLVELSSLDISYNHFGGELPLWMLRKNLTGQMELLLHRGYLFEGNAIGLPHDIGSLNGTLINTTLDLSGQGLGGPLPASFSNLTSLRELNLSSNNFNGSIGPLSTLTQLSSLDVSSSGYNSGYYPDNNRHPGLLEGSLTKLSALVQLTSLQLQGNHISGPLYALSALTRLTMLDASYNYIGGTIPTSFEKLRQLNALSLQCCNLTGTIPPLQWPTGTCILEDQSWMYHSCGDWGYPAALNIFCCPLPQGIDQCTENRHLVTCHGSC
jgi:hypothetical protein